MSATFYDDQYDFSLEGWTITSCDHCEQHAFWKDGALLYPASSNAPLANEDMPADARAVYDEARSIETLSPKSAAALLRLAVQHICIALGLPGKNLNDDIGALAARRLDPDIIQLLDIVRVTGNHQVHPGMIDLSDDPAKATVLFELVNEIVAELITRPKRHKTLYDALPAGAKHAADARNKKAQEESSTGNE